MKKIILKYLMASFPDNGVMPFMQNKTALSYKIFMLLKNLSIHLYLMIASIKWNIKVPPLKCIKLFARHHSYASKSEKQHHSMNPHASTSLAFENV